MMATEYRIEFTITRQEDGEDDFSEIGFGSSGAWSALDQCAHIVASIIDNNTWEHDNGMPHPNEIDPNGGQ